MTERTIRIDLDEVTGIGQDAWADQTSSRKWHELPIDQKYKMCESMRGAVVSVILKLRELIPENLHVYVWNPYATDPPGENSEEDG